MSNDAAKMVCKYCNAAIDINASVCEYCGMSTGKMVRNTSNGNTNDSSTEFNSNNQTTAGVDINSDLFKGSKNKWVALILCVFLGYLGAHKFYEGKIGMGILYLFTGGLFGIGWVIDIIALLLKPDTY